MATVLGATTLPNPTRIQREFVETSSANTSLTGRTYKDIRNRKERFTLTFERLTKTEVDGILSEYNAQTTKDFSITEDNLTIVSTPVHIIFEPRDYIKGGEFRTDVILVLLEVL